MRNTYLIIAMLTLLAAQRGVANYVATYPEYVISVSNQLDHLMNIQVEQRPKAPSFPATIDVTLTFPQILKHADLHSTTLLINSTNGTISVPLDVARKGDFVTTSFSMERRALTTSNFTLWVGYSRRGEKDVVLLFRLDIESFLEKEKPTSFRSVRRRSAVAQLAVRQMR